MAEILKGKPAADALNEKIVNEVNLLSKINIRPALAIVRVGSKPDDIAYERGAVKRCEKTGAAVRVITLPEDVSQNRLVEAIQKLNEDRSVHGILLLRPLPAHIDDDLIRNTLAPEKDVDGITDGSLAGVFVGTDLGFPPCTPQACMEMLDYYGVEVKGKNVVVIGRSTVVGKPAAMMLTKRHGTVTICHTRTVDLPGVCRQAEILIAAAGKAKMVSKEYLSPGQIVIDVGINFTEDGSMCGDVDFDQAKEIVAAITPVPGGVGAVTTAVLVKHVVEAAKRQANV